MDIITLLMAKSMAGGGSGGGGGGDVYTVTGTYTRDPSTGALSVSVTNNIEDVIAAVRSGKYITARISHEAGGGATLYLAVHSIYDYEGAFFIRLVSPFIEMLISTGSIWCTDSYMLIYNGSDWTLTQVAEKVPLN